MNIFTLVVGYSTKHSGLVAAVSSRHFTVVLISAAIGS